MLDNRFFDHTERNHFEAGYRLQLRKLCQRKNAAVYRRLIALVKKRRDGYAAELGKRIMDDRLVADVRQNHVAAGSADNHRASKQVKYEMPAGCKATQHRLDRKMIPAPLLANAARTDTGALPLSTAAE